MFLQINKIEKSYYNSKGEIARKVLDGVDLSLEQGGNIAIIGPSGSGKTTILNIIGTLDTPDIGNVRFKGQDISSLKEKEILRIRNSEMGFIFQQHYLLPYCNVIENVLVPTIPQKTNNKETFERAEHLLNELGLYELRYSRPDELSGGECQRVAVVRALINSPALLLADEPTGALDYENSLILMDLLLRLNSEKNIALIVVTHSVELAKKLNLIYKLTDGKLHIQLS